MQTTDCLIALIRCALTGEKVDKDVDYEASFDEIIKLAGLHEVSHLAALAMLNCGLKNEKNIKNAKKCIYDASFTDTKNMYTYGLSTGLLSGAKIPFMPLKGVIMKKLYPESWMRTSCDIDVLVHKDDIGKAVKIFKDSGFTYDGNTQFHDVSLIYDNTNLELHFSICEDIKNIDALLENVWDYAESQGDFMYLESKDFFAFHHVAHMLHHFISGGCGVRPFIDLWILKKNGFFDGEAVGKMCQKAKIDVFFDYMMLTADVWFEDAERNDTVNQIEKYVLKGGAYGYYPSGAAVSTVISGGKIRHLRDMAFPSYKSMCSLYPVIEKAPVLLPFCYLYRMFEKTFGRNNGISKKKYRIIKAQDKQSIKEISEMVRTLKLDM